MATYTNVSLGSVNVEHVNRMVAGLCGHFGYRETDIDGNPNPELENDYIRRKLRRQVTLWVKQHEDKIARQVIDEPVIDMID